MARCQAGGELGSDDRSSEFAGLHAFIEQRRELGNNFFGLQEEMLRSYGSRSGQSRSPA
jgi:hypothetical protein